MATMKGKRVLTSLYLDPPIHEALKALTKETRVPTASYLREAVDDLLAKHGRADSPTYDVVRSALRKARPILTRYRSRTNEGLWHRKIDEAVEEIDNALDAVGDAHR
jgi:hypothetical protein